MIRPAILALALVITGSAPVQARPPYAHDARAIVRVQCDIPDGWMIGTAVRIGPNRYITAAHVVAQGTCRVGTTIITVTGIDAKADYALFTGPTGSEIMPVNCDGFRPKRIYMARGYAGGGYDLFELPWIATPVADGGETLFLGDAIHGMSGGSVIDVDGRLTGIVNRLLAARSLPLSATSVCA